MTYLKIAGALLAVLLAFGGGYRYAAALYEKDAAELREAEAVARADMGRKQYAKMVEALDALAGLRAELSGARADAERVRRAAEVRERRASASACGAERAAVSASKDFSEKVSDFSRRVEDYFRKQPEFTTPQ